MAWFPIDAWWGSTFLSIIESWVSFPSRSDEQIAPRYLVEKLQNARLHQTPIATVHKLTAGENRHRNACDESGTGWDESLSVADWLRWTAAAGGQVGEAPVCEGGCFTQYTDIMIPYYNLHSFC